MAGTMTGWLMQTPPPAGWRFRAPSPQVVKVQTPAAGADWTLKLEPGSLARVTAVTARLTTATTVGTRVACLSFHDPDTRRIFRLTPPTTQVASLSMTYTWAVGIGAWHRKTTTSTGPLPDLVLPPHCLVKTRTFGIASADQWSAITLLVELF